MAQEYDILSWYASRYFLKDLASGEKYDGDHVPTTAGASDEITDVLTCNLGQLNKDIQGYRTLGGNGYEAKASLGNSQSDATIELVRAGQGDAYAGAVGSSTYTKLRHWQMTASAAGGSNSPKCIVEVIPRGNNVWEGTCYYCHPTNFNPGERNGDSGQTYSIDVSPFGPPIPLTVTYDSTTDTFSFVKAG